MTVAAPNAEHEALRHLPRPLLWVIAARLKTLGLSITPIIAGSWYAASRGSWRLDVLLVAMLSAVAIQIGTNLWNDAADAASGTDGADRLGPPRVTALGLLDGAAVRRAAALAFALAAGCGVWLVAIGGWPIVLVGLVSLGLGYGYSMGPIPLSATPLGEVLVIAFFGVVAVNGTAYLHGAPPNFDCLWLGLVLGLPAAAVLLINNHRDRQSDTRGGRRTLAILAGESWSKVIFCGLVLLPIALISYSLPLSILTWISLAPAAIWALWLCASIWRLPISRQLNRLIPLTATYQIGLLAIIALEHRILLNEASWL